MEAVGTGKDDLLLAEAFVALERLLSLDPCQDARGGEPHANNGGRIFKLPADLDLTDVLSAVTVVDLGNVLL